MVVGGGDCVQCAGRAGWSYPNLPTQGDQQHNRPPTALTRQAPRAGADKTRQRACRVRAIVSQTEAATNVRRYLEEALPGVQRSGRWVRLCMAPAWVVGGAKLLPLLGGRRC